jgi:hypothetical protein
MTYHQIVKRNIKLRLSLFNIFFPTGLTMPDCIKHAYEGFLDGSHVMGVQITKWLMTAFRMQSCNFHWMVADLNP